MKAKKYWLLAILVVVICVITWCLAGDKFERNSLVGLKGVGVVIEELSAKAERYGLSREQIRNQVERHLRKHGIKVLCEEERLLAAGRPHLYITVKPLIGEKYGMCAIAYDVSLKQDVRLVREPSKKCVATTWNHSAVNLTGTGVLADSVKLNLSVCVDEFINEYVAAKTLKPPKKERSGASDELLDDFLDTLLDGEAPK
ncbi:MAG: hypothetical protein ACYS0C_06290 [Planctomycetota bacterium]